MSPTRAECDAAAVARSAAIDAAWAEVTARFPLPDTSHQRGEWMRRHRADLRAAYQRHLTGAPNPEPTLPFGDTAHD